MDFKTTIESFPDTPGVYLFKKGKKILYIGKATSLKDRVRSYFNKDLKDSRSALIEKMIEEAESVDYQETGSVLEALVLEANLIKKYQPIYNTKEKDNKSFNYIVFTDEDYPRIFTVRGQELRTIYDPDEFKYVFGPFTSSRVLQEALKIIRKIFPFRGEKDPVTKSSKHSRLYTQIGLLPDFGIVAKKEYQNTILNLKLFFEGKKGRLLKKLAKEMGVFAKKQEFEKAEEIKRKMFALQHINDIALIQEENLREASGGFRIESYDVAHIAGVDMVGVMVVLEGGFIKKTDYRKFKIKSTKTSDDTKALIEVLERRLKHDEWTYPNLFVIDGGKAQLNAIKNILKKYGIIIPVVSVVKDNQHKPKDILGDLEFVRSHEKDILVANQEAHRFSLQYHRNTRRKNMF